MSWHRLEPTDAYFSYDLELVYAGLDMPSEGGLREALRRVAVESPDIFRFTDRERGMWRPLTPGELRDAPDRLVACSSESDPRVGWHIVDAMALDGFNFRIVKGDGWLGVRAAHGALMDGFSIGTLLQDLVGSGGPTKVDVVGSWQRDLKLARYLAQHPETVRAALAYRRAMNERGWERPPAPPGVHTFTHVLSAAGYVPTLRAARDKHWPDVPLSTLALVGFRSAMSKVGVTPRAGAEVLYDIRRYLPTARPLFGNWSSGVQLQPADDYDPVVVHGALKEAAASGLPVAAMAAGRVLGRAARSDLLERPVPAPVGAPRISYTHLGPHSTIGRLPWRSGGPTFVLERTRPANAEALTVMVKELGDYFMFNVSHYDAVWPSRLVREAAELFIDDPVGTIRAAQAQRSTTREVGR